MLLPLLLLAAAQEPAPTVTPRWLTDRPDALELGLPAEEDAFQFAVFGDRTGGPASGVKILAEAVDEVNLVAPDLVMTVGDLIQGYNTVDPWLEQMAEYKSIMGRLVCPWFPVAGNHDVYWRGEGRPPEEHEGRYETHFGPLWYAFRHKRSWFFVLYTDEPNPETGERNFGKADCQRMSPEQYAWLDQTLKQTTDAEHVFVFLHHPRWIGGRYGNDWERVHQRLVEAGNVDAVFAGHIHHMRYDGPRDGIEYFALATIGGHQSGLVPEAGYLHHYYMVTVREGQVAVANYPVGSASDPRKVTGEVSNECAALAENLLPSQGGPLVLDPSKGLSGELQLTWRNPVPRPVEVTWLAEPGDARWLLLPDHHHATVQPGETLTRSFRVLRGAGPVDAAFQVPRVDVHADYLGEDLRVTLPVQQVPMALELSGVPVPARPELEQVLVLDGGAHLSLPADQIELPDGPLTIEAWVNPEQLDGRVGLATKTEGSEYGLFLSGGEANFSIHLNGSYVVAKSSPGAVALGRWTHVAGVFDGSQVRLYLDGALIQAVPASGDRTPNDLPLIVGGDVGRDGQANSFLQGQLDELRISTVARYGQENFRPQRRLESDGDAALLLHFDGPLGPWVVNAAVPDQSLTLRGGAKVLPIE